VVVLVLQFMPDCRRTGQGALMFMLGLGVVLGAFLLWVQTASDFGQFRLHAWEIPLQLASKRIWGDPSNVVRTLLWFKAPLGALLFNPVCLLVSAAGFAAGMMTSFQDDDFRRRLRIASAATVSILAYQNLFQVTTGNDLENGIPFVGLAFALTTAVAGELFYNRKLEVTSRGRQDVFRLAVRPNHMNVALVTIGGILLLILSRQGLLVDFRRTVNQFAPSARFERRLQLPRIGRVRWGEPTRLGSLTLEQADFENVVRWLERKDGNFFVFSDATILYGLLGRASPQPMLYFQRGQSYREADVPQLEDEILGSLGRNDVKTVVLEKRVPLDDMKIASFPKLNRWIRTEFERSHEFGLFEIWEKR